MAFLFGGTLPPEVIARIHREGLPDLSRLATAQTRYFVIGNYDEGKKHRVHAVRDQLSEPPREEAFILDEIDPDVDVWMNFYVKFRVFLLRCQHVVGVFEDNDGGHTLEIGEADLLDVYVLKREYDDRETEHDAYDGMLGTLFQLLNHRDHLYRWHTEDELLEQTRRLQDELGRRM